jgi:hypothetical protein
VRKKQELMINKENNKKQLEKGKFSVKTLFKGTKAAVNSIET